MNKEKLEYELGRYKRAVIVRDQIIEDMKADMAGMQQIQNILGAYIVLLAEGKEVKVDKNEIAQLIKDANCYDLRFTAEGDSYVLKAIKKVEEQNKRKA